jgi:hypothetical protein
MKDRYPKRLITRRSLLRQTLAGTAMAGASRLAFAADAQATAGASPEVRQITRDEFEQSNIYCEVPYCSRSSRYMVYARTNSKLSANRTELMVVELGTWKEHRLDAARSFGGLAITPLGILYYLKQNGELDLMRVDLDEGTPRKVYSRKNELWVRSLGTASSDGRYYAGGVVTAADWTDFGVMLLNLDKGAESIIDRDPFILNPHPQFDPAGTTLLIQQNRGGKHAADGKLIRLVGEEGATLYMLSVPDGKRTELKVGKPFTTPCTGHEAWIGTSGEVLLSVSAGGDYAPDKGNLLGIRAGEAARVVCRGYRTNHVGASRCGRFFSCDDSQPPYRIIVGSVKTGRTAVLCESRTTPSKEQNTHAHPYLTPDLKWMVFNSNRTGRPHVYAAAVPEGLLDNLEKA